MLTYSLLEGRIRPRYYVFKFLKENGLLDRDRDYYSAFKVSDDVGVEAYCVPVEASIPSVSKYKMF
jgi:mTERF domain-containing protein